MSTEKTTLILHGHFYQPPRENPRTGVIDIQETAAPFPDWNENIWNSCYRANAHSRYLSGSKIELIANNYASISFNFGPTLLAWMQQTHPDTVEAIIDADRLSRKRLGHGNAIAQGFNHTILPLDKPEDAELEIVWALEAFRACFGRDSEGFWCPECAINPTVVDLLAKHGVSFVILSPWQCQSIEDAHGNQVDLAGKPAPCDRPFLLTGDHGRTLTAFFYDPELASGISFGHMLRDADAMYARLLAMRAERKNPALIHTATDGEIYGHHEAYGDMALCALVRKVQDGDAFVMSNYATFLAAHPATEHAVLKAGEDHKGTSWSCVHGVSRWYKDCGCHTGGEPGWNQKWRTPLRQAFDLAHEAVMTYAQQEAERIFGEGTDIRRILVPFARVASHLQTMDAFLAQLAATHPFAEGERHTVSRIAEMVLYSMYGYTSCGWFFNDLNGIEPRQDIAYALRSIELYQELSGKELLQPFLAVLDQAACNRPQDGTGRTIALSEWNHPSGPREALLFFAYSRFIGGAKAQDYGRFHVLANTKKQVRFQDTLSLTTYRAALSALDAHDKEPDIEHAVLVNEETGKRLFCGSISTSDLTKKMIQVFNRQATRNLAFMDEQMCEKIARHIETSGHLVHASKYLSSSILESEALGVSFIAVESMLTHRGMQFWGKHKDVFLVFVHFLARVQRPIDRSRISTLMNEWTSRACDSIRKARTLDDRISSMLTDFVHVVREQNIALDLTILQETIWPFITPTASQAVKDLAQELNFSATAVHA